MKTLCIMDWVSRTNGGIFEAERRLQQTLQAKMGIGVEVLGLRVTAAQGRNRNERRVQRLRIANRRRTVPMPAS